MLLLPIGLNYFHVFHPIHGVTLGFIASALALAAIAVWGWRTRRPFVAYGILWMAATLAPALNLTGLAANVFTERYLYLPSVGFCWIVGWAWWELAQRKRAVAQVAAAVVMLACVVSVFLRNRDWADSFTMLQATVKQSPDAGLIHDALAGEYIERERIDEALEEERLAVKYEPRMALLHKKLGYILLGKDPQAASVELQKAAELEPDVAANHFDAGTALEAAGERDRAAGEYRRALELQPDMRQAREALDRLGSGR
jgi:tetratricopeptide (TPR) repeat protein